MIWAAAKIGKPIKWVAERGGFSADAHGRDHNACRAGYG